MNRGGIVTAAFHILEGVLEILPLSSKRVEEGRADGRGGSPEEKSCAG